MIGLRLNLLFSRIAHGKYIIRLEKGDDILPSLRRFAAENRIGAGLFEGIGSLNTVKLGHYDFHTKNYKFEIFSEDLEILSLSGNIATMDKAPLPHAHVTLGKRDFSVIGGHLDDGSLANMVEIGLSSMTGKLVKSRDDEVGLNLLQLRRRLKPGDRKV